MAVMNGTGVGPVCLSLQLDDTNLLTAVNISTIDASYLCSASACSKCGNGVVEAGELCDDGEHQLML